MTEEKFTYSEKRLLTKFLGFLSKNIIFSGEKYEFNFNLETFDPYATDTQSVKEKLSEIVHALGYSVKYPRSPARG